MPIQQDSHNENVTIAGGNISVDNFPAVQPVNDNGGSLTVDGTVNANVQDGAGNDITSTVDGATRRLDVSIGSEIDPLGGVVTIDYAHHQVHEGESWSYCNLQTGGLASGSNFDIRISVPVGIQPHFIVEAIADGVAEIYLHRGVTWTSGGTAVAASGNTTAKVNLNNNSANAPGTLLFVNGGTALTVNSTGTVTYIWYLTSSKSSAGSTDRSINEKILAENTEYMLRLTSRTTSLKFLIRLSWYEA